MTIGVKAYSFRGVFRGALSLSPLCRWKKYARSIEFEHFWKCTPKMYHRVPPFQISKHNTPLYPLARWLLSLVLLWRSQLEQMIWITRYYLRELDFELYSLISLVRRNKKCQPSIDCVITSFCMWCCWSCAVQFAQSCRRLPFYMANKVRGIKVLLNVLFFIGPVHSMLLSITSTGSLVGLL